MGQLDMNRGRKMKVDFCLISCGYFVSSLKSLGAGIDQ
jgi:hypothetical protein